MNFLFFNAIFEIVGCSMGESRKQVQQPAIHCKRGEDRASKCAQPEAQVVGLHGLQCELGALGERAVHKRLMEPEDVEVKKIERICSLLCSSLSLFLAIALLLFELQSTSSVALVVVITSWTICGLDGCRKQWFKNFVKTVEELHCSFSKCLTLTKCHFLSRSPIYLKDRHYIVA